jgi:hypothetical protein
MNTKKPILEALANISGLNSSEIMEIFKQTKENRSLLDECDSHNFIEMDKGTSSLSTFKNKYICTRCKGVVDFIAYSWYLKGFIHGAQTVKETL